MSLQFRYPSLLPQWNDPVLRRDLRLFVLAANAFAEHKLGKSLEIISIFRDYETEREKGRSGMHGLWRAIDVSVRGWAAPDIVLVQEFINDVVDYGQGRQVCFVHDAGQGLHFHFQVPAGAPTIRHV